MTRWNHSIDSPSPLLAYTPDWMWHTPTAAEDPSLSKYSNGSTVTTTNGVGATVTFTFYGTGVWVYGAKRTSYGYYNVTLDDKTDTLNGNSPNDLFGQVVFGKSNLEHGQHSLSIVNAGSLDSSDTTKVGFDVDWVVWETEFDGPGGPVNAQVTELTFDDSHPRFQFLGSWDAQTNGNGTSNGTSEVTSSDNASVQFTFDGDAIAVYGAVDPSHGNFSADVDGLQDRTFSGHRNVTTYQQMLYYAEDLGAGTHNLIVKNVPVSSSRDVLSVDYVKTWTARGGSNTPAPTTSKPNEIGPIAGGVVGGVVFLAALAFLAVFFLRRRRRQKLQQAQYPASPFTASVNSDTRDPFSEEYAVHYASTSTAPSRDDMSAKSGFESNQSHASQPSMGSISSTVTDSSTQQLIAASMTTHADDVIPMSRMRPSSASYSKASSSAQLATFQYPSPSLHPNLNPIFPSSNNPTPFGGMSIPEEPETAGMVSQPRRKNTVDPQTSSTNTAAQLSFPSTSFTIATPYPPASSSSLPGHEAKSSTSSTSSVSSSTSIATAKGSGKPGSGG